MSLPLASDADPRELLFPAASHIAVSSTVAAKLGLSTAMILGYFHEALQDPTYVIDDVPWIEVTLQEISLELRRGFSTSTIRRYLKKLESLGLMQSCRLSTQEFCQTKSYTICYDTVAELMQS